MEANDADQGSENKIELNSPRGTLSSAMEVQRYLKSEEGKKRRESGTIKKSERIRSRNRSMLKSDARRNGFHGRTKRGYC